MKLRILCAGALAALAVAAPLAAAAPEGAKAGKSVVCHATHSAKNPVVLITISDNAVAAHKANHGDDVYEYVYGECLPPGWDAL